MDTQAAWMNLKSRLKDRKETQKNTCSMTLLVKLWRGKQVSGCLESSRIVLKEEAGCKRVQENFLR
jgi:hypothetical protein